MFCKNCGNQLIGTPEICPRCGARPLAGNAFCQNCGATVTPLTEICTKCGARVAQTETATISPKSKLTAALLAFFLGGMGIHRFYLGKVVTGIIMLVLWLIGMSVSLYDPESGVYLLFLLPIGIWALADLIHIARGKMKDGEGKLVTKGNFRLW